MDAKFMKLRRTRALCRLDLQHAMRTESVERLYVHMGIEQC